MAKEKSACLGNEVSQPKKNLTKKMQELNNELILDKIFVPIPGLSSNFILGPCFKTTFPPELSPLYPLAKGEKLLLHSVEPDWFKGKTLRSWPSANRKWIDWVDRVEKAKGEVWKSAGIYDAIQLSKNGIPMDNDLLYAALCYWSISTNSFHFRFGMMGPTVLDIVALTGLRPHGEEVSAILGMAESACDFPKYGKIYNNSLFYPRYLNVSKGEMAVTEEEHVSFLFAWLSNHLFCDSSVNMIKQCTKLAFEEVVAPKSNGIKGNSQSVGNFGQNMKRKYEGDSIPSQSLVQQDEPIQQKNSHEAGEKIPMGTTSSKKMKTSPRKMLLPCSSVFRTSCTPANEDWTKTDIEVSADARSISTSSSTSDKDGEDDTVSSPLANTRSKTSGIIVPPDCPVKFDNLEDFFARVSGQIKRAQSLGFSADQCSPNFTPSAEMLATAKDNTERLLLMPSQDLLLPKNCSTLSAALSTYAATPDLSSERALALKKLK
ncbi:uncharacterized protein [Nicotiana tomentosiformis]|uniref:uncharacterized protein n=1 Tax=Nicotiana tomentosiformis TaxID=4098 RepID=UPI00388CC640